jgi:hypothetical protein
MGCEGEGCLGIGLESFQMAGFSISSLAGSTVIVLRVTHRGRCFLYRYRLQQYNSSRVCDNYSGPVGLCLSI